MRAVHGAAVAVFAVLFLALLTKVTLSWSLVLAFILGLLAADLLSGLVHWFADTWFHSTMPLLGRLLLQPFREHHKDPSGITRHDFIETNGNSCLVAIPVLAGALFLSSQFWTMLIASLAFWVLMTNQIHKWAHQEARHPIITALQRSHLLLPPEHHRKHHSRPFISHYCITTGWFNYPLEALGAFRAMEWIFGKAGISPREEDALYAAPTP
jgi:plasmanylethanolamine desaturase